MNQSEMMQKVRDGNGFIAALDQSGGSTPRALKAYGLRGRRLVERRGDVAALIHQMRVPKAWEPPPV